MYERFYGFREPAFELTSNPKFLFFTAQHREALCNLEYGLSAAKPVTVLIGDAGTGKSTLARQPGVGDPQPAVSSRDYGARGRRSAGAPG